MATLHASKILCFIPLLLYTFYLYKIAFRCCILYPPLYADIRHYTTCHHILYSNINDLRIWMVLPIKRYPYTKYTYDLWAYISMHCHTYRVRFSIHTALFNIIHFNSSEVYQRDDPFWY